MRGRPSPIPRHRPRSIQPLTRVHMALDMLVQTRKVQVVVKVVVKRKEKKRPPSGPALGMDPSAGAAPIPLDADSAPAGVTGQLRKPVNSLGTLFFLYRGSVPRDLGSKTLAFLFASHPRTRL